MMNLPIFETKLYVDYQLLISMYHFKKSIEKIGDNRVYDLIDRENMRRSIKQLWKRVHKQNKKILDK